MCSYWHACAFIFVQFVSDFSFSVTLHVMTLFGDDIFNDANKKIGQFVFASAKMLAFTETKILLVEK